LDEKNYEHLFTFGKKFKQHLFTFGKKLYRNIKYMPAAIFFVRLDLEKNSSFLDRH